MAGECSLARQNRRMPNSSSCRDADLREAFAPPETALGQTKESRQIPPRRINSRGIVLLAAQLRYTARMMMWRIRETDEAVIVEDMEGVALLSLDKRRIPNTRRVAQFMVDGWNRDMDAQFGGTLRAFVGLPCIVKLKGAGDQRGYISAITSLVLGKDQEQSINLSEFKVDLPSGDVVTVPGSALRPIDKSNPRRKP